MKKLFTLLLLTLVVPLSALNAPEPDHKPVVATFSSNKSENARRAVRLGYANFKRRFNTPETTATDSQIAVLITTSFRSFFEKLNNLEDDALDRDIDLHDQYSQEFNELVQKLNKLFLKNQTSYLNDLLLDEKSALQETLLIVQEAVARGSF